MEPAIHYRPADHAVSLGKAMSAWLVYGFLLVAGLGLPSLWAEVTEAPPAPITARAPTTSDGNSSQVCDSYGRSLKPVAKGHLG